MIQMNNFTTKNSSKQQSLKNQNKILCSDIILFYNLQCAISKGLFSKNDRGIWLDDYIPLALLL